MRNNILAAVLSAQSFYLSAASTVDSVSVTPIVSFVNEWGRLTRRIVDGATGYLPVGHDISIGPLYSFVGYNSLEGLRLGTGVSTTTSFSHHLFLEGDIAYGFSDRRWKYSAEAGWSFNGAKEYFGSYPINYLQARYSFDTDPLGDNAISLEYRKTSFRLSLRRNEMILYHRFGEIRYIIEPTRETEIEVAGSRERYYPTRYIVFDGLKNLDAWRMSISTSWSPGNHFYQDRHRRLSVTPYTFRLKGRLQWIKGAESDHTDLLIAEFAVGKDTPLYDSPVTVSALAHATITWGQGAFPFLPALPVSPYILTQSGRFALLRPLELPADKFTDLHIRIDDGGLLTGMIPVIKSLNISVTTSASVAVGSLSTKNDPLRSHCLISFPYYPSEMLSWSHPYAEIGVGLDHILGIGRIEYVRRLSYLSDRGTRKGGIAIGLDFTF